MGLGVVLCDRDRTSSPAPARYCKNARLIQLERCGAIKYRGLGGGKFARASLRLVCRKGRGDAELGRARSGGLG